MRDVQHYNREGIHNMNTKEITDEKKSGAHPLVLRLGGLSISLAYNYNATSKAHFSNIQIENTGGKDIMLPRQTGFLVQPTIGEKAEVLQLQAL